MAHLARSLSLGAALLAVVAASPTAPDALEEWQDPAVSGRNREPAHATMLPFTVLERVWGYVRFAIQRENPHTAALGPERDAPLQHHQQPVRKTNQKIDVNPNPQ